LTEVLSEQSRGGLEMLGDVWEQRLAGRAIHERHFSGRGGLLKGLVVEGDCISFFDDVASDGDPGFEGTRQLNGGGLACSPVQSDLYTTVFRLDHKAGVLGSCPCCCGRASGLGASG
jgi:hypothetical protein